MQGYKQAVILRGKWASIVKGQSKRGRMRGHLDERGNDAVTISCMPIHGIDDITGITARPAIVDACLQRVDRIGWHCNTLVITAIIRHPDLIVPGIGS